MARGLVLATVLLAGCGDASAASTPDASRAADAAIDAHAAPDAPPPRAPYPIVLAHGFFGFEDFAGAGFVDYFWRVREDLAAHGETLVFTPAVDPFNSSEVRGAQLLAHVERIVAETGAERVNIVGHSQGGLDARVVAHDRPDLVASVTTIATPHGGSRVSDVVLGLVSDPRARDLADALARAIASPLYDADGAETSVFLALRQFGSEGIADFDVAYPDAEGVAYFSIAGRTDLADGGEHCRVPDAPAFVARWTVDRDPTEPLLALSEDVLSEGLAQIPNDALVTVPASVHGRFLGCIPADHFDEIGQLLGDDPGTGNELDHRAFYRELVAWLRAQGY